MGSYYEVLISITKTKRYKQWELFIQGMVFYTETGGAIT
jgi:hypothetical protein